MKFKGFLHFNIRCSENDLPAIEKFYGELLGWKKGFRPNFQFDGAWLYDGDEPIVHDGETAAVVVQGSVELEVRGQRRRISSGGGFQLLGKQPYRLTNPGRQTAIVVCACTPSLV